jgi:hypothetical protein
VVISSEDPAVAEGTAGVDTLDQRLEGTRVTVGMLDAAEAPELSIEAVEEEALGVSEAASEDELTPGVTSTAELETADELVVPETDGVGRIGVLTGVDSITEDEEADEDEDEDDIKVEEAAEEDEEAEELRVDEAADEAADEDEEAEELRVDEMADEDEEAEEAKLKVDEMADEDEAVTEVENVDDDEEVDVEETAEEVDETGRAVPEK